MKFQKISAIYSLVVALGMIGVWAMLMVSGQTAQLPNDLQFSQFSFSLTLASDLVTACALLVAGVAFLVRSPWANKVFLVGMIALFYSLVNELGLIGQRGDVALLAAFNIVLVTGLALTIAVLKQMPVNPNLVKIYYK